MAGFYVAIWLLSPFGYGKDYASLARVLGTLVTCTVNFKSPSRIPLLWTKGGTVSYTKGGTKEGGYTQSHESLSVASQFHCANLAPYTPLFPQSGEISPGAERDGSSCRCLSGTLHPGLALLLMAEGVAGTAL